MKHLILALTLAVAATACTETVSTHGQIILPSRLAQVQPGVSTKSDVQYLLGSPSTTGTFNDNRWYYLTSTLVSEPLSPNQLKARKVIAIDFDPSGTVAGVQTLDETAGKPVTPDTAETATHGQSLGVLDSMMQNVGMGGF
ncbi:MAG: outer membrane protein assembly factor BamE [Pseudomonadaceae bacterium]|nr:outer membrane protein assembly factor BamE [Pseudomonadaceae bacterium]